jgi:hypothetical protein
MFFPLGLFGVVLLSSPLLVEYCLGCDVLFGPVVPAWCVAVLNEVPCVCDCFPACLCDGHLYPCDVSCDALLWSLWGYSFWVKRCDL